MQGSSVLQLKSGLTSQKGKSESLSHTYRFKGAEITVHANAEADETTGQGRWIIIVKSGCTSEDVAGLADRMPAGTEPVYQGHPSEGGLCTFMMLGTKEQVEEELASHNLTGENVVVESDTPVDAVPEVPEEEDPALLQLQAPESWGLDRIDDKTGLDSDYSPPAAAKAGAGVHVYVFDTGINTAHTDFGGRAKNTLEVLGWSSPYPMVCSANTPGCAVDRQGHGTHCAATVGGTKYGVAKAAMIHSVKVLKDDGRGYSSWGVMATDWVMQNGKMPAVLSMSLGGKGPNPSRATSIDQAVAKGISVVVAAGNDGDTDMPNACDYSPAGVASAITVGSTTRDDSRSYFSNYGTCVDIFAPGSFIKSASHSSNSGSTWKSGTSMACPHVSGAVALLLGENPKLTPAQILAELMARSMSGMVTDRGAGSPNKLLNVMPSETATPAPTPEPTRPPTPSPTPVPTPSPTPRPTPSPTPMPTEPPTTKPPTTKPPTTKPPTTKPPTVPPTVPPTMPPTDPPTAPPTAPPTTPCSLCAEGYKLKKNKAAWKRAKNPDGTKHTCLQAEEKQNSELAEKTCAEAQEQLSARCCKKKKEKKPKNKKGRRHRRRS